MEPIHRAAWDGDVATIDRLVAEDGRRLNAQIEDYVNVDGRWLFVGTTALMLAALRGHDAAVARLLALGANVGLKDMGGCSAVDCACLEGDHSSVLALLLDAAGASIDTRTRRGGRTLFDNAIFFGRPNCVALLIERGGNALDLDANNYSGGTALHEAAFYPYDDYAEIMQLLLQAGADPTVRTSGGKTALDWARRRHYQPCIFLLEAALIEPQRSRLLFKARALLEAPYRIDNAFTDCQDEGLSRTRSPEAHSSVPSLMQRLSTPRREWHGQRSCHGWRWRGKRRSWWPASSTRWGWRAGAA